MTPSVQILLPGTLSNTTDQIYFKGYVKFSGSNEITVYIVKFIDTKKLLIEEIREDEAEDVIYGYVNKHSHVSIKKSPKKFNHFLILNQNKNPKIESLVINGKLINIKENYIIMYYDFNKVLESEVEWEYCDNLYTLQHLVQNKNNQTPIKPCNETRLECPSWLSSSMFIQHFINYLNIIKWLITTVKRDKKISIKQGNLILAVLMDLILGYLALYYLTQDTTKLSSILMGILEKLINLLYSLLKWLMGAPAGLKLNNAFNKMLGKYFSYHVQLWWLFLDVSGEKLDTILHIYFYLGYLGFTFQAAAISDMISIATFHSYCIYVYAARMFHIQISGIIALLRFFVGRKYNPLRGSIDSCEYTNQELFVGTVAFTILLLLLPTTLMYYIVFTVFRVLSLLVQYTLAKLIHHVHTLPLYVSALWLMRSPKVAGNVLLEVDDRDKDSLLTIRLRLHNKSIFYLVSNFRPPVDVPKSLVWTNFFSNVFIGKQII